MFSFWQAINLLGVKLLTDFTCGYAAACSQLGLCSLPHACLVQWSLPDFVHRNKDSRSMPPSFLDFPRLPVAPVALGTFSFFLSQKQWWLFIGIFIDLWYTATAITLRARLKRWDRPPCLCLPRNFNSSQKFPCFYLLCRVLDSKYFSRVYACSLR